MCDFFAFGVELYHIGTNIGVWHTIQPTVQTVHLTDLTELCTRRNMIIYHDQVKLFFLTTLVDGGKQHSAGLQAHHRTRRQIGDRDQGLADELFRFIVSVDAGKDRAVDAGSIIQRELQKLLGLLDGFGIGCDLGFTLRLHGRDVKTYYIFSSLIDL